MSGLELAVAYLAAWAWRKARRVAGRADTEIDYALDAGMDRLHDLVADKLVGDPALERLEAEAGADLETVTVSARTHQRVQLALEDATETNPDFATELDKLVAELRKAEQHRGRSVAINLSASGERSIAAGRDITGIASTGDHPTIVQYQTEHATVLPPEALMAPAAVDAPQGLVHLPLRPGVFVGRAGPLNELDAALATGSAGVVVQAVHGLGGIGKSTLAAHWVNRRVGADNPIWWITADTPAAVDAGLADLAVALQPALSGVLPLEALRERALLWLASHTGWLLVLDNVVDPADVAPLLARIPAGRFLITSRKATGWAGLATPLRLNVLEPAEAVELMTGILTANNPGHDLHGIAEVCDELGCLPLAVEQAAAYMAETGISPRDYLRLLAEHPADLYRDGGEGRHAERTIARIWRVTLDRLADDPLTGHILRILAWYAPDAIPRTLLDPLAEQPAVVRAIGRLAAYNMLTADTNTLTVHRLVQAVARTPDPDDPHRSPDAINAARTDATVLIAGAVPADERNPAGWPAWRTLLPHIDALADHTSPDTDTKITCYLLTLTGLFLQGQGALTQAIERLDRAHTSACRVLGSDHPDTLTSAGNLANAYHAAGDLGRAIPLLEQTLADRRRILGNDDAETLSSANDLANAYRTAGDLRRAIPLHEQTLTHRRRILGSDHPQTLSSASSLAATYEAAGDLRRAIPLHEQTLTHRRRILGNDHPHTLASANNLANAYQAAGNLRQAIPLHEQTLTHRRRILGPDHPHTLASANNLAYAYQAAGNLRQAIPLLEQTLTDRRRILGPDHPDTLTSAGNLASAYYEARDLDRAIPLLEQTLADRRRVLGNDHPHILSAANNLAAAYEAAGDMGRAIPLLEQTLADRRRILGNDHPQTLTAANNLAAAYEMSGDLNRAIPLYEQTLADAHRLLGNSHPQALTTANNLAYAYEAAGDLNRAIPLYEQTLAICRQVLGARHPVTQAVQANLAELPRP